MLLDIVTNPSINKKEEDINTYLCIYFACCALKFKNIFTFTKIKNLKKSILQYNHVTNIINISSICCKTEGGGGIGAVYYCLFFLYNERFFDNYMCTCVLHVASGVLKVCKHFCFNIMSCFLTNHMIKEVAKTYISIYGLPNRKIPI